MTQIRIRGTVPEELTADATKFYEQYWDEGATVPEQTTSRSVQLLKAVLPEPPESKRILEIGVGAEGGIIRLLKDANEVCGLDASAAAVASCARLGVPARQLNNDREVIPFPADYFDVVFAFEVCEHLANPQFAIEEIRRTLKPGGLFVASTPNPLIHHWPRFFYPSLIERDAFRDFLLANRFHVRQELGLYANRYAVIVDSPADRSWSWVWISDNVKNDPDRLLECGKYFWDRVDDRGVRMRPMEAADLFRAILTLNAADVIARGLLAAALVYRVINGEETEFRECLSALLAEAARPPSEASIAAKCGLCLTQIELLKFGLATLRDDQFSTAITEIGGRHPTHAADLNRRAGEARRFADRCCSRSNHGASVERVAE